MEYDRLLIHCWKPVPNRIELTELGGGAGARVSWGYMGQTQIALPPPAFSH